METSYYAPPEKEAEDGIRLDFRMKVAIDLMRHFGVVAGVSDGEDSAGRAKLRLMQPQEVVDRAFAMADYAISKAEQMGWIKPVSMSMADAAWVAGILSRIRSEADSGGYRHGANAEEESRQSVIRLRALLEETKT